jgi:hypothetical protein
MALFPLGILSAAGAGGAAFDSDFDLLETVVLTGTQAGITFTSLGTYSSTYKHLQLRMTMRSNTSPGTATQSVLRLNGVTTGSSYASHTLQANGSTVSSQAVTAFEGVAFTLRHPSADATTGAFAAGVIDFLDPFSTTKNKTVRIFQGSAANENSIYLNSGLFASTSSLTSIGFTVQGDNGSYIAGTRLSLYGIKG